MEEKNDLREIEGVSGAFFQPSIDDVGKRICVHAIPASDVMDYHGMPAFQEVGPLVLDANIMEKAKICAMAATPKFPVMVENGGPVSQLAGGKKYLIVVSDSDIMFEDPSTAQAKVCKILFGSTGDGAGNNFPVVKPLKNSGTAFTLAIDDHKPKLTLSAESNITRDILCIILRNKVAQYASQEAKKNEAVAAAKK